MIREQKPALIVIFGITGDLARRKLMPALYHLIRDNLLHPETQILGVTRQKLTKTDVLKPLDKYTSSHARPSPAALRRFRSAFHLLEADLSHVKGYKKIKMALNKIERQKGLNYQRVYYLSIPPSVLDEVISLMGEAGLQNSYSGGADPSILVEKPFGYDQKSAKHLVKCLKRNFKEAQIYRIDHYLAKEMAQNIINFRFDNPLFSRVWSAEYISKVVITAYEKIGIEGRVAFYEQTGALRDLIQSHLLQLMCLVAMEKPAGVSGRSAHTSRLKLLRDIETPLPFQVGQVARRGQYASYRQETGGGNTSVETYAELHLSVNNSRWKNVPFVLKTGKALSEKTTKIEVFFGSESDGCNRLELRLQPEESVVLDLRVKQPGHDHFKTDTVMDFSYRRNFSNVSVPEAYERVLLDAINGSQLLFASSAEVLEAWRIVQPVLDEWSKSDDDLKIYKNGIKQPFKYGI